MKTVDVQHTTLDDCVTVAQSERVVVTRDGNPIAIIVGVEGLDAEQIQLGSSDAFWKLIAERRGEKPLTRAELESRIARKAAGEKQA